MVFVYWDSLKKHFLGGYSSVLGAFLYIIYIELLSGYLKCFEKVEHSETGDRKIKINAKNVSKFLSPIFLQKCFRIFFLFSDVIYLRGCIKIILKRSPQRFALKKKKFSLSEENVWKVWRRKNKVSTTASSTWKCKLFLFYFFVFE